MGRKATFEELWTANESVLAECFPSQNPKDPYDRSSADAALASHLAFWTGKNHERMKTYMLGSGLVRDKWTKHKNYLVMTIKNAVNNCTAVHKKGGGKVLEEVIIPAAENPTGIEPVATTGVQFMSASQQVEYFKNCVYIKNSHRVLTPNGSMIKPEVFKASYAGFTFALDSMNEKTTKSAWEAFIDNQAVRFPKMDNVCFRPLLPPYTVINEEGFNLVNTYVPVNIARKKGDVSRFLRHMEILFPIDSDRFIILAYMAAVVQHQGVKFQWCPIIQGAEGNGKSLISRVLSMAVGQRYSHFPDTSQLANGGLKFNGWIQSKLFIAMEEIYVSDRRELTEPMKTLITNDRIEIQFKGGDQYTGDNLANFLMLSNHKDCMKLTYDQRRYWMYFCPQQTKDQIINAGMTNKYFQSLYDWLKKEDGYAYVTDYLMSYKIPDELNPATLLQTAPRSSSTDESVQISLGIVEQHVLEAVEEERQGFRGGYISSKAFNNLLVDIRMDTKITPTRRLMILESLGYIRHPHLRKGRVDNPVAAEGSKVTIYCKNTMQFGNPQPHQMVKENYEKAQGYAPSPLAQVI